MSMKSSRFDCFSRCSAAIEIMEMMIDPEDLRYPRLPSFPLERRQTRIFFPFMTSRKSSESGWPITGMMAGRRNFTKLVDRR